MFLVQVMGVVEGAGVLLGEVCRSSFWKSEGKVMG
jgi:hypothetical protein